MVKKKLKEQFDQFIKEAVDVIDGMLARGELGKSEPIFEVKDGKLICDPIVVEYLKGWSKEDDRNQAV